MTDVAGSTRLWEARAESMRAAIARHDAIVNAAVEANGGQRIKERGEGDSHFCVFPSVDGAVRAAISIQERLPHEQWETGAPLVVRMSIHTANAEPHDGDYYGRDVNRCARIRAAAHGGQVLASDTARDQVSGFDFLDLGLHRLMDLSEQQRIYQLLSPDIQRDFPPIRSLNAVKHNLPVQLTSFIGRERELNELRKLVMGPRLVTILGPGGAGKTRTALQLAAESIEHVKGGVWFVDLSPIQDGSTLSQKVIEDLYIRVGADDPDDAIAAHFQGEKTLLLLDNCEHVARDAAVFTEKLLKRCSNLFVIATSREPLGVSGERAYRLPPMEIAAERTDTLEDISHLDSVQLLLDRARAKGHDEVLEHARPLTILELCKKLDGIPLALEQAAANLGVLSPETMLSRLDERLSILSLDDEGVEARHRTLSAAIDWSYDTLGENERSLFLDLAVFSGGWTLEAAESICEQPKVLDLMQRLVAKSLVWPEATAHGDRRFRLLETVREYALEKRSPIPKHVAERHLAYFAHLAMVASEAGLDSENGKWARALDADHTNIIAALNASARDQHTAVEGLALADSMFAYWHRRDFYKQGGMWTQMALDAAVDAPQTLRADSLNGLGIFAIYQQRLGPAKVALEASRAIWRELGNRSKEAAALNNLAWIAKQQGGPEEARAMFYDATHLLEQAGDDLRLSDALQNLAQMDWQLNDKASAISINERALKLTRRSGEGLHLLAAITNLLGFYAEDGGVRGKLDLVEEAIDLAETVGNVDLTAAALDIVASLAHEIGDSKSSARLVGSAAGCAGSVGIVLSDHTEGFRHALADRLLVSLGRQAYRKEFDAGSKLAVKDAIAFARTFIDSNEAVDL